MKIYGDSDEYDDDIENGYKKFDDKHMVVLYCTAKKLIVSGVLNNDISTSISNQWGDFFQNGLVGGMVSVIDTISSAKNAWNGVSLHQPFMSRKMWGGTSPLSFDLDMTFVAVKNAKEDVFEPITKLCAMAVAHKGKDTDSAKMMKESIKSIQETGKKTDGTDAKEWQKTLADVADSIDTFIDTMAQTWVSPGPVVLPTTEDSKTNQQEAPITLILPSFGNAKFENCYIENIGVTFSKTVDADSYPMAGNVKIKISRMDAPIAETKDGEFTMNWNYQYTNKSLEKLSTGINKVYDILTEILAGTQQKMVTLALGGLKKTE